MSRLFYKKLDIYIQSRFQRNKFRCYNLKTFLTELNTCPQIKLNNIKNVVQQKKEPSARTKLYFQRNKFRCYNLKTFLTELNTCPQIKLNNIKNVVQQKKSRRLEPNCRAGLQSSPPAHPKRPNTSSTSRSIRVVRVITSLR